MVHAIVRRHVRNVEGVDSLEAPDIEAVLLRVGATLMMRVYAAIRAKVVTRGSRVELIEPYDIRTFDDFDA